GRRSSEHETPFSKRGSVMVNPEEPPAKAPPLPGAASSDRRPPRWTSATLLGLGAALLLGLVVLFVVRAQRLARREALDTLSQFRADLQEAQFRLLQPDVDRRQQEAGIARCRRALSRFAVLDQPGWRTTSAIRYLATADQEQLREEIAELLFLLARTTARQ